MLDGSERDARESSGQSGLGSEYIIAKTAAAGPCCVVKQGSRDSLTLIKMDDG